MTDDDRPIRSTETRAESEDTFAAIERALVNLWAVANDLSVIRPPEPKYYRVTVFGSSRMKPGDPLYEQVKHLAADLAASGCDIVTGGGPGLMQAANEGERLGDTGNRTRSIGLPIELPHEEAANPFVEKMFRHRTFFSRLHHFVRLSSAFIVVRGGIGTSLEAFMVWQLLQVRHIHDRPLIFVGRMWQSLIDWTRDHMLENGPPLASAEDLGIPRCVETVDEACRIIREHKRTTFDHRPGSSRSS